MPRYDGTRFTPPAPVANLAVRHPETGATVSDVPMLLDTGADITLLPRMVMAEVGLLVIADRHYELAGFDGTRSLAEIVFVDLLFGRRTFRGQYPLIDQAWGILGRNVLNSITVLLDGPRLSWDEQHPR